MPPKRLLRGGSGYPGASAAGRRGGKRLPAMLFALIAIAMSLLAWNLSTWKQLPSLLDHLLAGFAAVRHYQPADHTVMGAAADTTRVLPTDPFQAVPTPQPARARALISEPLELRRERPVRSEEEKTAATTTAEAAAAAEAAETAEAAAAAEAAETAEAAAAAEAAETAEAAAAAEAAETAEAAAAAEAAETTTTTTTSTTTTAGAAAAMIADASRAQEVGRTEAGLAGAVVAIGVTTEAGAGTGGGLFYAPPTHRVMPDAFDASKPGCMPDTAALETAAAVDGGARPLSWIVAREDAVWPAHCDGRQELCDVVKRIALNRAVMVAVANSHAPGLQGFLDSIAALKVSNFMVVAIDKALADNLQKQGVPYYFKHNNAQGNHGVSAQKFGIIRDFVEIGCSVLLSDTDVVYIQNPFSFLYGDSDIESMSDGWDNGTVNGFLDPVDDPALGLDSPARRKQTLRVAALNSGLWYVSATAASRHLMQIMQHRMATEDVWDQSAYNMELWQPSRDAHFTGGCTIRVMSPLCFVNSKVMFRYIRHKHELSKDVHLPVAVHANYHTDKPHKMRQVANYYLRNQPDALTECRGDGCSYPMSSCAKLESHHLHSINDGIISARDWRHAMPAFKGECEVLPPWDGKLGHLDHALHLLPSPSACTQSDEAERLLCDALTAAALASAASHEVLLTVVDASTVDSLSHLLKSLAAAKVTNVVVAATDAPAMAAAAAAAQGGGVVAWAVPADVVVSDCRAEAKWRVVSAALRLGFDVLSVDPETVFFRDPFRYLYRDSDVESATDGWDDTTAYGVDHVVDDPSMGWSRFVHGFRAFTRDPGLAFLRSTQQSVYLAARVAGRLAADAEGGSRCGQENGVFNEELWLPSHGRYASSGAVSRVMNYLCFPNSKGVVRFMRNSRDLGDIKPVAVRLSYHPSSPECSQGILDFFHRRDDNSIASKCARAGVAPAREECDRRRHPKGEALQLQQPRSAAAHAMKAKKWSWGGVTGMEFQAGGVLKTPWGEGAWGVMRDGVGLWCEFAGAIHVLTFEAVLDQPFGMFVSQRCGDGDIVVGREIV